MNKAAIIGIITVGGIISAFGVAKIMQGDKDLKSAVEQLHHAKSQLDSALTDVNNAHSKVDSIMNDLKVFTGTMNKLNTNVQNLNSRVIINEQRFQTASESAKKELTKTFEAINTMRKNIPYVKDTIIKTNQ